jgi:hypothetical protein
MAAAIPDEFRDLVKLNAFIGQMVKSAADKSRVLAGGFDGFHGIQGLTNLVLKRLFASGNKLDCLIHSFLHATCPNFKLLNQADKDEFSDKYRRRIFILIAKQSNAYRLQNAREKAAIERRILSVGPLENLEITILCEYYHVKILVFEIIVGAPSVVIYGLAPTDRDDTPVYMIYNPGRGHFEPVRVGDSSNYTIPFKTAEILRLVYQPPQDGLNFCQYDVGDKIIYEDTEYYITYRRLGDQGVCEEYGLTTNEARATELVMRAAEGSVDGAQFVADNEVNYAEISVPAGAIETRAAPAAAPAAPLGRFGAAGPAVVAASAKPASTLGALVKAASPTSVAAAATPVFTPEMAARLAELRAKKAAYDAWVESQARQGGSRKRRKRTTKHSRKRRA